MRDSLVDLVAGCLGGTAALPCASVPEFFFSFGGAVATLLEVLLLDNNLFSELPSFLCTLPKLRVIGIRQNLLDFPK